MALLFRSKISTFDIIFKRLSRESFENLQIVVEHFKPVSLCPIKWQPITIFAKLHKSPLLTDNIVKGAVSGQKQFLATKSH